MNHEWLEQAACKKERPDDWFSDDRGAIARARAVCYRCPVREQCLAEALEMETPYGMFGGCTPTERRAMRDTSKGRKPVRITPKDPRPVKDCPSCNRALDRGDFAVDRTRADGMTGECKACRLDGSRRRREARKQAS